MKTNYEFIKYIENIYKNKNTVYMWGDYGREVTNNTINSKSKQYPSHYSTEKIEYLKSLVGKNYYSFDCAGLIKSYWMSNFGSDKVKYNSKYDKDAYGITIGLASEKGDISTIPNIPGVLLYMKGHCGIYLGDGYVYECTSSEKISKSKFGCVCKSKLSDRKWTNWTKIKWLDYIDINNPNEEINEEIYIVKKGDTLTKIAKLYNTTIYEIAKINNIKNLNLIYIGQKLKINGNSDITYVIKKGDTLSKIAKKYNTTWQTLYEKNKDIIKDPNKIYPNQIIKI